MKPSTVYLDPVNGYVLERYNADARHPLFPNHHTVPQHRRVMAEKLGRELLPSELVHHRDEVKTNNAPDNLELTTRGKHLDIHRKPMSTETRRRISEAAVTRNLQPEYNEMIRARARQQWIDGNIGKPKQRKQHT